MESAIYALLMTLIAGASTSIGALLGIFNKKPKPRMISFMMAFSAGVMVFISFTELYSKAEHIIGTANALIFLVIGLLMALFIDILLPERDNVHEHVLDNNLLTQKGLPVNKNNEFAVQNLQTSTEELNTKSNGNLKVENLNAPIENHNHHRKGWGHNQEKKNPECVNLFCIDNPKFMKLGIFTMLALSFHNFPEGLATFSASLISPQLGFTIMLAIMLHNIPEGLCVAVPIYIATGNKKKAFAYASISGMAEPLGAIMAWLILAPIMTNEILMCLLAFVAGIMIYISVDTLIPTAKSMDYKHTTIIGFSLGLILMGISLMFL